MHTKWTKTMTAALLAVSLAAAPAAGAAFAQDSGSGSGTVRAVYQKLTSSVSAQLKGAYIERTADGSTVGAVIRLRNGTGKITRVPDYELRMESRDGVSYTLAPSAANPRSIQAKGYVELVYSLDVNRTDDLELTKLVFVEVDEYVYPRKETTLLSMDITGKVWRAGEPSSGSVGKIGWGQPFRLESLSPNVTYTPAGVHRQTTEQGGTATVVTLKAVNAGKETAYIPDFAISGSDGAKLYPGQKADGKMDALEAGETRNVRFAIPTPASAELSELVVTTPARFAMAGGGEIVRHVGHLRIGLPESEFSLAGLKDYTLGAPIELDPANELVDKDVQISLVELHLHDNQGDGYKTAIAKFKLLNTGKQPAPLPAFQAELTNGEGYTYVGDRQITAAQRLLPGLSHVVSYAFNVPKTEEEGKYALRLLEGGTADAPYSTPFAQLGVAVQNEAEDSKVWDLYPFQVKMKDWTLSAVADAVPVISYSYKLTLDLDIARVDDVVVDANFSKLKIEIADSFGKMLGSETFAFVGANRLISGKQTLRFNNIRTEQHQYPLTIHIYEAIDTPSGEATRLIQTLKQK